MVNLARMYTEGLGIPPNQDEANRLFESAAKAGEFVAQIELGRIYSRGLGVTPDATAARRWYLMAIAQEPNVAADEEILEAKAYLKGAT